MSFPTSKRLITSILAFFLLLGLITNTQAAADTENFEFTDPSFMLAEAEEDETDREYDYILNKMSVLWELAQTYMEAEKIDQAIETYIKILKFEMPEGLDPRTAEEIERDRLHIYLEIAELYMDLKQDKEKAIEYLHTGLDKIADRQLEDFTAKDLKIEYLKRLGTLYREKGNLEKSIEYLNRALEIE